MDCHFLLQGIFPTQRLNLGLPHCSLPSESPGKPLLMFKAQLKCHVLLCQLPQPRQIGKWNTKLHGKAQRGLEKQYKQWRASLMAQKVKNSPQCRRPGFDPWSRMIPEEGNGTPLQYSCLESCYRARHNWETNKWREGKQKIATHGHYRIITCMIATIIGAIHCYLI